ncbi:MAG: methyltransferase domain-containing protein [Bacteroidota bacterium]
MDQNSTSIKLCDPYTREPLLMGKGFYYNPVSNDRFFINSGIPVFLPENQMSGDNLKYSRFYDRISRFYRISSVLYCWLKGTTERKVKKLYLDLLEIKKGDRVLEVSSGSADNLLHLPGDAFYTGFDISFGMLTMARRQLKRWKIEADLFQGEAEHLPFADDSFDVVFHVGGINFFNNKQKALSEMIRVARPGSKLLVVDETESMVVNTYQKNPFSRKLYQLADRDLSVPVELLPAGMKEIEVRYFFDQKIYCLTFRKPAENFVQPLNQESR